ncbi:hypothetical protein [Thermodesulfitimonas autotrophica]|uniref:hypothetical protein n=1 Tax=Thermodesulfitimonas autotrophica TaxID=1894989 RepID=UPI002FE20B96
MELTGVAQKLADFKIWLDQIAVICLSEEFQRLRAELESFYKRSDPAGASVKAFADALYTFLSEAEESAARPAG